MARSKSLWYISKDPVQFYAFSRCRAGGNHHDSYMDMGFGRNCTGCYDWNEWRDMARNWFVDLNTGLPLPYPNDGYVIPFAHGFKHVSYDDLIEYPELADQLVSKEDFAERFNAEFFQKHNIIAHGPALEDEPTEEVDTSEIISPFDASMIEAKLNEGIQFVDAAFKILGLDPSDTVGPKTEGARSRFYRYVTGDFSGESKSFPAKSLAHPNARYCFGRFIKGTEFKSHIDLAKSIALENWKELGALVDPEFTPEELPQNDNVGITGEAVEQITSKAILVTGYGWLPRSKVKFAKGKMWIPAWLAKKSKEAQGEK